MAIVFECEQCGKSHQTSDDLAGRRAKCKQCGAPITIPGAPAKAKPVPPRPATSNSAGYAQAASQPSSSFAGLDEEDYLPPPKPIPTRVKSSKKRLLEQTQGDSFRNGLQILLFGLAVFILPLFGLQWRVLNLLPPVIQQLVGVIIVVVGFFTMFGVRPGWIFGGMGIVLLAFLMLAMFLPGINRGGAARPPGFQNPPPGFGGPNAPRGFAPPGFGGPNAPPGFPPPNANAQGRSEVLYAWIKRARMAKSLGPIGDTPGIEFKIDYKLFPNSSYLGKQVSWVITSSKGKLRLDETLEQEGTLTGFIKDLTFADGPFTNQLEAKKGFLFGGGTLRLSNLVELSASIDDAGPIVKEAGSDPTAAVDIAQNDPSESTPEPAPVVPSAPQNTPPVGPGFGPNNPRPGRPGPIRKVQIHADKLNGLIEDLKSGDEGKMRSAAVRLRHTPAVADRRAEVARLLESKISGADEHTKGAAIKALAAWWTPESVPVLINVLHTQNAFHRWDAIDLLGKIGDQRAVAPIVDRLDEDSIKAVPALIAFGSTAELEVLRALDHPKFKVRFDALRVLKEIATEQSLPRLKRASQNTQDILVAKFSAELIQSIENRARSSNQKPN
jgi:hypothetical protein